MAPGAQTSSVRARVIMYKIKALKTYLTQFFGSASLLEFIIFVLNQFLDYLYIDVLF